MSDKTDFYDRLHIGTGASEDAIKKAYRQAVRKTHPDVNKNAGATQLFLNIQEAYKILSDPNKKDAYDAGREPHEVVPTIHTSFEYSQKTLTRLAEPQIIYSLVDVVSTQVEKDTSELPLNISFVLDNSTSMDGARLEILKAATKEIIHELGEEDLVSVISFNDRAKVLMPSQSQPSSAVLDSSINSLFAEGGTEIFQGLEAAFEEIRKNPSYDFVNHIILITDGHTYGDEDNCITLAKSAANFDIGISGLGIGIEWNDEFIDKLCALTGGQCRFIQELNQVKDFLSQSVSSLREAYSRRISLEIVPAPGVKILSAFRILPEALPLPHQEELPLGILKKDEPHRVLFEFMVDPIPEGNDQAVIASGEFILKRTSRDFAIPFTLDRPVVEEADDSEPPPAEIFRAISHLTFYRLQEKAQQDIASGNPGTAFQRLINLSSHLMAKGEDSLAKIAMNEADYIKTHSNFSPTGKKQLKYGTMRLLLPDKTW
ncbi:MAG: VWA domain-containing protein [Anaerolineales bacterium]|nr:VWA domain-containing protein [Anaerolineales bacterium]